MRYKDVFVTVIKTEDDLSETQYISRPEPLRNATVMFFKPSKPSKKSEYIHYHDLCGHSGAILALRATEDGRLLASGGA